MYILVKTFRFGEPFWGFKTIFVYSYVHLHLINNLEQLRQKQLLKIWQCQASQIQTYIHQHIAYYCSPKKLAILYLSHTYFKDFFYFNLVVNIYSF